MGFIKHQAIYCDPDYNRIKRCYYINEIYTCMHML